MYQAMNQAHVSFELSLNQKLPLADEAVLDALISALTAQSTTKRKLSLVNFVNKSNKLEFKDKAVLELLRYLYVGLLDPVTFLKEWKLHALKMLEIAQDALDRARRRAKSIYKEALAALPESVFSAMIESRVNITMETLEKVVMSTMHSYKDAHTSRSESIVAILGSASQHRLFAQLTPEDRTSPTSDVAIRIQEGNP
jgi:hypothetical protein